MRRLTRTLITLIIILSFCYNNVLWALAPDSKLDERKFIRVITALYQVLGELKTKGEPAPTNLSQLRDRLRCIIGDTHLEKNLELSIDSKNNLLYLYSQNPRLGPGVIYRIYLPGKIVPRINSAPLYSGNIGGLQIEVYRRTYGLDKMIKDLELTATVELTPDEKDLLQRMIDTLDQNLAEKDVQDGDVVAQKFRHILLVDDRVAILLSVLEYLKPLFPGALFETARDHEEAIKKLKDAHGSGSPIDLVVTDLKMGSDTMEMPPEKKQGARLIAEIRGLSIQQPKIIVLAANTTKATSILGELGADAVVDKLSSKGFLEELYEKITRLALRLVGGFIFLLLIIIASCIHLSDRRPDVSIEKGDEDMRITQETPQDLIPIVINYYVIMASENLRLRNNFIVRIYIRYIENAALSINFNKDTAEEVMEILRSFYKELSVDPELQLLVERIIDKLKERYPWLRDYSYINPEEIKEGVAKIEKKIDSGTLEPSEVMPTLGRLVEYLKDIDRMLWESSIRGTYMINIIGVIQKILPNIPPPDTGRALRILLEDIFLKVKSGEKVFLWIPLRALLWRCTVEDVIEVIPQSITLLETAVSRIDSIIITKFLDDINLKTGFRGYTYPVLKAIVNRLVKIEHDVGEKANILRIELSNLLDKISISDLSDTQKLEIADKLSVALSLITGEGESSNLARASILVALYRLNPKAGECSIDNVKKLFSSLVPNLGTDWFSPEDYIKRQEGIFSILEAIAYYFSVDQVKDEIIWSSAYREIIGLVFKVFLHPEFEEFANHFKGFVTPWSLALATVQNLKRLGVEINNENISMMLKWIETQLVANLNEEILSLLTGEVIIISSQDPLFNPDMLKNIAIAHGVDSSRINVFKGGGESVKEGIRDGIRKSRGPITIWFDGHGGVSHFLLAGNSISGEDRKKLDLPRAISWQELAGDLFERFKNGGQLKNVIIDACFSFDFTILFYTELYLLIQGENERRKGDARTDLLPLDLPLVFTTANLGSRAVKGVFKTALERLGGSEPITLRTLLEVLYEVRAYQDGAVFLRVDPDLHKERLGKIQVAPGFLSGEYPFGSDIPIIIGPLSGTRAKESFDPETKRIAEEEGLSRMRILHQGKDNPGWYKLVDGQKVFNRAEEGGLVSADRYKKLINQAFENVKKRHSELDKYDCWVVDIGDLEADAYFGGRYKRIYISLQLLEMADSSEPRTTASPRWTSGWLRGVTLRDFDAHSSPSLQTGPPVVRGEDKTEIVEYIIEHEFLESLGIIHDQVVRRLEKNYRKEFYPELMKNIEDYKKRKVTEVAGIKVPVGIANTVRKFKMLASIIPVREIGLVQRLLENNKFIKLDVAELDRSARKEGFENKAVINWLRDLSQQVPAHEAKTSPFVLYSSDENYTVGQFLQEYGLDGTKFFTESEFNQLKDARQVNKTDVIDVLDLSNALRHELPKESLSMPLIYSVSAIYLAAHIVLVGGKIEQLKREDPLIYNTLMSFYTTVFGNNFTEEILIQMILGTLPLIAPIAKNINSLREAIAILELEVAA